MDPEYNYLEKIPQMHRYRKKSSMFDTAYTIEDNLTRTAGILITGEEDCPTNKRKKDLSVGNTGYYEIDLGYYKLPPSTTTLVLLQRWY